MTAYIFDTEATDRENGEIIEAAWLRFEVATDLAGANTDAIDPALDTAGNYDERFLPVEPTTCGALVVHGILPSELSSCRPTAEFKLPADCAYLIGHSIDFDWKLAGAPENVKRICTHAIAQHLWPDADSHSLAALQYHVFGMNDEVRAMVKNAHGAAWDCIMVKCLLAQVLLLKPEIKTWSALHLYSEQCRIPLVCPFAKYKGVPLVELPHDFIYWCLRQDWLDPYMRKGLERALEADAA